MDAATIRLFLPFGDAKRLRTGEISNWSGKAVAAPRTDLDEVFKREEISQAGVYLLFGTDPESDEPLAYIGEAEVIRDRLRYHGTKDFWISLVFFVSKDENLTKGHIRYLEGRMIEEAERIGRYRLDNSQGSGSRLPESDREDMEVFLSRVRQLLPVLGSDILTPVSKGKTELPGEEASRSIVHCRIKGAEAHGQLTPNGFVVFEGSRAVINLRPSAKTAHPFVIPVREKLISNGTLIQDGDHYRFTRDTEFGSPSAAAAQIHGGGANGWKEWKDDNGRTLGEVEGRSA